ncbi:RNA methyltransferase [Patescibacteria group bacterium]|nr:RNA methyltransferase [Patescibacteria group bacterium]MBU0964385.1 RNA methyltransferase [Patescibacteria group bacterium]
MKIKELTSSDNEKIKSLRKLNQKKYRLESRRFFIENAKIINDALSSGTVFESLFITENFAEKNKAWLDKILSQAKTTQYYLITDSINATFSNLDTPPGIGAVYKKIERPIKYNSHIVYLNGINDPGNLGTILRSALAFGIKNIVLDEACADVYNFKTLQAAKDSIFKLNISFDKNYLELKKIKSAMKVYSTKMDNAVSMKSMKQDDKFCLVLGSEAHGVSQAIQDLSDGFVKIDIRQDMESLNVASAAAIFFYEMSQ